MKVKSVTYGRKLVFDKGDRYCTQHIERCITIDLEEGDDVDRINADLELQVDSYLAVKAVEIRFGNQFKNLQSVRQLQMAEQEANQFLNTIGLGHCKIDL